MAEISGQKKDEKEPESLEKMFEHLEEIVARMEREDLKLEEAFSLYHEGMLLLKECSRTIDKVEKQVLVLDENGETYEF